VDNVSVNVKRTPELIAAEINNIKTQTRNMVLYNSIEIGRRLTEAKELISHGEWGKWLERSVSYSQSTAQNLMRIFNEYGADQITLLGDNAKSQALGNLSYTQAVALLGIPQEEREQFIEEHDIDSMSTRELQQAVKEKEEAIKENERLKEKLESAISKAQEAYNVNRKLIEDKKKAEEEAKLSDNVLREEQENVRVLQMALKKHKEDSNTVIMKLQSTISGLNEQLSRAQDSGDADEVNRLQDSLNQAENELEDSKKRIEELENQLKEKPVEAAVTIQNVPDNKSILKYSIIFDDLVKKFGELLGALAEIKESNEESYAKYKNATSTLINKMSARL
jgi:chromosome segregation ATPase